MDVTPVGGDEAQRFLVLPVFSYGMVTLDGYSIWLGTSDTHSSQAGCNYTKRKDFRLFYSGTVTLDGFSKPFETSDTHHFPHGCDLPCG